MAVKHKNLFLYLALVCFVGIILIFIFDGYIGVYDRLVMDNNQYIQTVEGDQWEQNDRFPGVFSTSVERGGRIDFTYTIENHRFSAYSDNVGVLLYHNKVEIGQPYSGTISIPAFAQAGATWSINVNDIIPSGYPAEQAYNVNVIIKRGDIAREVAIYISPQIIIKPAPVPQ